MGCRVAGFGAGTMGMVARIPRLIMAAVGAIAVGIAMPAAAQQAASPVHPPAKKVARPLKLDVSPQPTPADSAWTIEDALPKNSPASRAASEEPPKGNPGFGRLQLDAGSVGVETEPKFKDNTFSDGRKVPGLEYDKRNAPSYFGLSLSVPADKLLGR